jgi:hypothetical protein
LDRASSGEPVRTMRELESDAAVSIDDAGRLNEEIVIVDTTIGYRNAP